jgi:hypothetical protein
VKTIPREVVCLTCSRPTQDRVKWFGPGSIDQRAMVPCICGSKNWGPGKEIAETVAGHRADCVSLKGDARCSCGGLIGYFSAGVPIRVDPALKPGEYYLETPALGPPVASPELLARYSDVPHPGMSCTEMEAERIRLVATPEMPAAIPVLPRKTFMELVQERVPSAFLGARPVAMREAVNMHAIHVWVEGATIPVEVSSTEMCANGIKQDGIRFDGRSTTVTIGGVAMRLIQDPKPAPDHRTWGDEARPRHEAARK